MGWLLPELNPLVGDVSLGWAENRLGRQDRVMKPSCETPPTQRSNPEVGITPLLGRQQSHSLRGMLSIPQCVFPAAPELRKRVQQPQGALEQLHLQELWVLVLEEHGRRSRTAHLPRYFTAGTL